MTEGRARRQATVNGRGGVKVKSALQELAELRKSGGKRAENYEVKDEEGVYDLVNEDEYARIVQKRREEGGGFVVDEDGLGYTDIGEEIDWTNEDLAEDDETRGGKDKASKAGIKRKAVDQPKPGAKARMQKMFQSAAGKARPTKAPVDDKSTDALLDDILGNLGGEGTPAAPSSARPSSIARPSAGIPRSTPQPTLRVFSRPVAPAAAPRHQASTAKTATKARTTTPKSVSFAAKTVTKTPGFHRLASVSTGYAARAPEPEAAPAVEDEADDDYPMDDGGYYDDDEDNNNHQNAAVEDDGNDAAAEDDGHDDGMAMETGAEQPAAATAAGKTPKRRAGAVLEVETPGSAVPAAGWQAMYGGTAATAAATAAAGEDDSEELPEAAAFAEWVDDGTLPLDANASLPFYMMDAYEEPFQPGVVYMFGKVPGSTPGQLASCCAVVRNVMRNLFVIPRREIGSDEITRLAAEAETDPDAKRQLLAALHQAFSEVKAEVRQVLGDHRIMQMTMKPVMRQYAFENKTVPHGKQWVLKVRYPASQPTLPLGISGETFSTIFGVNQSTLESLMLKRKLMGPGWIALKQPRRVEASSQVSYCKLEVEVDGHKAISAATDANRPAPPLTVASVRLKTIINPTTAANEVVAASVVYLPRVETDGPAQLNKRELRHFSAVRKLDGVGFPVGFDQSVRGVNESELGRRNGGGILAMQPNERALLTMLVMKLKELDVDVFVGHNFAAYDLDVLLHRMQALKVPHWASLGRLKRSKFPHLGGSGHTFGGGASPGALSVVAGRLVCDTYMAARDLVKEVDYTLSTLSRNLLKESRTELAAADIPAKYKSPEKLMELVHHTESDAWLSLRLAFFLVVLPLTRQLAELSGSLWSKALMNQRAQRIEMLLLHEFHNNKFLLPDKLSTKERGKLARMEEGHEDDDENDKPNAKASGKRAKGPQYSGGLVLEPKKGLYDRFVLLLDFNSLYPSIIQEYNICFTTVTRPEDGSVPALPEPSTQQAPLPRVIGALVARRRRVKDLLKNERDAVRKEQLNIRQQALKLLANSMYGCLGFSNSRFYARPIAELITSQGREILQSTVDLVQNNIGREVIYGDTDSIMVYTGSDSLQEVMTLGQAIKREVNKRYKLLEIEMDGLFKCMLLLKKKKYAAIRVDRGSDGQQLEVVEAKGLDMVRRDWCPLSKQASQFALDRILSCQPRDEVLAAIHNNLEELAAAVRAGQVPLNKFIVTKQLTKRPEDYPDARNQPHVQVALRRREAGKRDGTMPGETVPYVICIQVDEQGNPLHKEGSHLAERAYSPDELATNPALRIDAEYYLAQQVHPVVSRLVAPVEGTDAGRLAECLGLDPSKFKASNGAGGTSREDALLAAVATGLDEEARYNNCTPLMLSGPGGARFEFKGVREILRGGVAVDSALLPSTGDAAAVAEPLTPAQVANQVQLRMREAVSNYYQGWLRSDDEAMPCDTRNICLSTHGDTKPGTAPPDHRCHGSMHQVVSEGGLYTQMAYYHRLFDVEAALRALGDNKDARLAAEEKLAPIREVLDAGARAAARLRDRSAYRWVDLGSVFGKLST